MVAAFFTCAATAEALTTSKYDVAVELPLAVAFTVPLLWRRTAALPALVAVMAVLVVQRLAYGEIWDVGSSLAVPMVMVFAVAAYAERRAAYAGLVLTVTAMTLADIGPDGTDFAFITLICSALWVAGWALRRQRELVAQVSAQALQLQELQSEREAHAVAAERTRIARELHDVVAHSVSTIVVQAEAGQSLLARAPDRAGECFDAIQDSGRRALDDLRRMLGLLRATDGSTPLGPQPGLDQLDELVSSLRATGLRVEVDVRGEPRPLPPGVDLSAYRIVQEALTNTLKHAAATRVRIALGYEPEALAIVVADDGQGRVPSADPPGHGLIGMEERARMHGGSVAVASDVDGFVVTARLGIA